MAIEVARDLAGLADANSAEFDPDTPHPVIATMADQEDVVAGERDMGGTMRLGLFPAVLAEGSLVRELYGTDVVQERHRHRYEVNNAYRDVLERGRADRLRPVAGRPPGRVHTYESVEDIGRIHLGRAGARYFVTVLAAGFDSLVNERANLMTWPRGQMRYNLATLAELRVFRPLSYTLERDGQTEQLDAMLVAVGNGPSYGGGLRMCEGAELDDGLARRGARDQASGEAGAREGVPAAVHGRRRHPPRLCALAGPSGHDRGRGRRCLCRRRTDR